MPGSERWGILIALFLVFAPCTAVADDFPAGSLIIPMDTDYQDLGMFKAYGLVYHLLLDGVSIHWCIKAGKGFGDDDFVASAEDFATSAPITANGYRGGPFVIDASDAAAAATRITSWQASNTTTVHRATAQFSCDVSRKLVNAPTIAMVADGNQKIARKYVQAAGIPDSTMDYGWPDTSPDMLTPDEIAGPTTTNNADGALFGPDGKPVYCQLMSMHWGINDAEDQPEVVAEVRQYLNYPTHFFAECQAVNAFENNVNGKFLTPNGFEIAARPNDVDFYDADAPFVQIDGGWETVGGSEPAYSLPPGDTYKANDITMVTEAGTAKGIGDVWMTGFLDGVCPPELESCGVKNFGKISYLGGHEYDVKLPMSQNPKSQGARVFLNSLFEAPCATEGGAPNIGLFKSGPTISTDGTATWEIEYNNLGVAVAQNVTIRDTLPAGATFVSASAGGTFQNGEVVWNVGTVASGEIDIVSVTVSFAAEGAYDNIATADYSAGLNTRNSTSNTATTTYCVPDDDASLCQMAAAQCGTVSMSDNCGQARTVDCEVGACDASATCAANACVCNVGYSGDGVSCTDLDECADGTATCSADATCANTDGGFDCTCNTGFIGDGFVCTDVDECTTGAATCGQNASCNNLPGTFECVCDAGYQGDGITCTDIDECATGTAACDPNATCTNVDGGYTCACDAGFTGDGSTCTDVDECATNAITCGTNAQCVNSPGSAACECVAGYDGDGTTCTDVDECADGTDTCDPNADCANTDGSFDCTCAAGFSGDGTTCTDVDECATGADDCAAEAICTNRSGGFDCACPAGFTGDGRTCVEAECGCGDEEVCFNDACYVRCSDDLDCAAAAERCYAGRCAENACVGVTCGADEVCAGGACFDRCELDDDCPDGSCFDGRCATVACTGITCGTSQICYGGGCFDSCGTNVDCSAPGDQCYETRCTDNPCTDVACPSSQSCYRGGCFDACAADFDCSDPGDRCFDERCAAGACDDVTCAAGEVCFAGSCFAACSNDGDCAAGEACFGGRCAVDACDSVQCPGGGTCSDGRCSGGGDTDDACTVDTDCAAELICVVGECIAPEGGETGGSAAAEESCGCASASAGASNAWLALLGLAALRLRGRRRRRF